MKPHTPRELDARERRFVDEYLIDLDPKRAAIAAGYSRSIAASKAYQWVSKSKVKRHVFEAIQTAQEARSSRTGIQADAVLAELAKIGFANMADYMGSTPGGDPYLDFSRLSRDQAAALQEVTVEDFTDGRGEDARNVRRVKFKLCDKRAALVDLGRHLGLFKDRIEHSGPDGKSLCIYVEGVSPEAL
jgi:phage terminase small subunit